MNSEYYIGEVVHFFNHINVAVIRLSNPLRLGDLIWMYGTHTDFGQEVDSMQIDHHPVCEGKIGEDVAIKVRQRVRCGDTVYHISVMHDDKDEFAEFDYFGR